MHVHFVMCPQNGIDKQCGIPISNPNPKSILVVRVKHITFTQIYLNMALQ